MLGDLSIVISGRTQYSSCRSRHDFRDILEKVKVLKRWTSRLGALLLVGCVLHPSIALAQSAPSNTASTSSVATSTTTASTPVLDLSATSASSAVKALTAPITINVGGTKQ